MLLPFSSSILVAVIENKKKKKCKREKGREGGGELAGKKKLTAQEVLNCLFGGRSFLGVRVIKKCSKHLNLNAPIAFYLVQKVLLSIPKIYY